MTNSNIQIEVVGIKEVEAKLKKLGRSLNSYASQAVVQASKDVLDTEGLRKYPPETSANQPPTPYYVRGMGTQYKSGNKGNSEKYGTQWHVDKVPYGAKIANRSSYAQYLAGTNQSQAMAKIGWRKLVDVVMEKMPKIKSTIEAWMKKAIKDAGL